MKFQKEKILILFTASFVMATAYGKNDDVARIQKTYPNFIESVSEQYVTWKDNTQMPIHSEQDKNPNRTFEEKFNNPSLYDQMNQVHYQSGMPSNPRLFRPKDDTGRIRYTPFFKKMYGNSPQEVATHLTTIYWLPKIFGTKYPLQVTTINDVDKRLKLISDQLETLVLQNPDYKKYLENPGGTYSWRLIANTNNLSMHSFGMTLDINTKYSNYWQWDLQKSGKSVKDDANLPYHNQIPWPIVLIFEKNGFIWGGKWYHYDTMHFEYRPEIMVS